MSDANDGLPERCQACGRFVGELAHRKWCTPSDEPRELAKEGPLTTPIALEDIPAERVPNDKPREEYVPSQSCEDDYLAIDGHIYPNRPLAKVLVAVLAEVARRAAAVERGEWYDARARRGYELEIQRAAAAIEDAMHLRAGGA